MCGIDTVNKNSLPYFCCLAQSITVKNRPLAHAKEVRNQCLPNRRLEKFLFLCQNEGCFNLFSVVTPKSFDRYQLPLFRKTSPNPACNPKYCQPAEKQSYYSLPSV